MPKAEAVCGAELTRESAGSFAGRQIRVLAGMSEIGILGDVGRSLEKLVADTFAALQANRKNFVFSQDNGGAVFIGVADFIQAGARNESAGEKVAILIVVGVAVAIYFARSESRLIHREKIPFRQH